LGGCPIEGFPDATAQAPFEKTARLGSGGWDDGKEHEEGSVDGRRGKRVIALSIGNGEETWNNMT